jgi:hypothetical protein
VQGIEDFPGYDAATRCIRLTTRVAVTHDDAKRPVGYLGRAHPLVRRALDRVRNLSFGGEARRSQDVRVSAVNADVEAPALLCTFLGRVTSDAGREYERVIATRVDSQGIGETTSSPTDWMQLADPDRAIRTADLWEKHFQAFGSEALERARGAAEESFLPMAEAFVENHREELERSRGAQARWLADRARETTAGAIPEARIMELFAEGASVVRDREETGEGGPSWSALTDPEERLAAFARDSAQSPARRNEAEGVLRIYRQRIRELEAHFALEPPVVIPLGLLMLVPEDGRGA